MIGVRVTMGLRLVGIGAVLAMAVGGCGEGSSEATSDTTSTEATEPSLPAAEAAARTLVPDIRSQLSEDGVEEFGTTEINCAGTDGPVAECVIEIPFMRLDECGITRAQVLLTEIDGEVGSAPDTPDESEVVPQICYVGPNGESVPSRP